MTNKNDTDAAVPTIVEQREEALAVSRRARAYPHAGDVVSPDDYFKFDCWKWGTHRVNCYPGNCPFRVYVKDGKVIREEISCSIRSSPTPSLPCPRLQPAGLPEGLRSTRARCTGRTASSIR